MSIPPPPPGQGPVDPRGAFSPPPPPMPGMPPPMPMMMPPMMYPPPPPPPRGGGFARGIFMTLATSIFGLSIAANVYLLLFSGLLTGGGMIEQTVVTKGDPLQKIAVVPVSGVIGDFTYERFDKIIKQLEEDTSVKALVVELDTPGGTVTASDEVYHRLLEFKEKKGVPIVAAMKSAAASGGYYIACATDHIVAQRTTITGSIGVLLSRLDLSEFAEKYGVKDGSLHSTGATYKAAGSQLKPLTPEEEQYLTHLIDDSFAIFKDVVVKGRQGKLKGSIDQIANGKAFSTTQAMSLGLVDQEGYSDDAFAKAASMAALNRAHVVRYDMPPSFLDALMVESRMPLSSKGSVVHGINLNASKHLIDEMLTPRLMYLWRGQ